MAAKRHFEPIAVGNCVVQHGSVRYAEPWAELEEERMAQFTEDDEDEDDSDDPMDDMALSYRSTYRVGAPRVCSWRSNLVALSQKYNLYFAAYRKELHITQPRNIKNTLPPRSDMVIRPPQTAAGAKTPGSIDPVRSHCINHIIIGNLGEREIILLSYDDGDVVAYDTQKVMSCLEEFMAAKAKRIEDNHETPFYPLDPFFHENVGSSAWGLAIHERSRLIAVGSNLREVTVFIFALTESGNDDFTPPTTNTTFPITPPNPNGPDRSRNQRRVINLGLEGHNIPSLDFSDDKSSQAQSVVATDIFGSIWILDIWEEKQVRLRKGKRNPTDQNVMGWSVMVLKPGCFKPIPTTPQEALGLGKFDDADARLVVDSSRFDVTSSRKDAAYEPNKRSVSGISGLETVEDDDIHPGIGSGAGSRSVGIIGEHRTGTDMFLRFLGIADKRRLKDFKTPGKLQASLVQGNKDSGDVKADLESTSIILPDGSAILKGQKWDLELIPPNNSAIPTLCVTMLYSENDNETLQLHQIHRLNMVASIPELSLAVIASQAGRVALITLTQPRIADTRLRPQPMFRIDYILPFQSQAAKPPFPLLGMAVSPLPDNMAQRRKESRSTPRRWRLMLHYYDHTILSYELSREATCNGLRVL